MFFVLLLELLNALEFIYGGRFFRFQPLHGLFFFTAEYAKDAKEKQTIPYNDCLPHIYAVLPSLLW